jgi:beta-galactosidase
MEQQPGPVNWAPYNPVPLPGMVKLWSWEAFAHGAETISYFRWRQTPVAQEQLHSGLRRPDDEASQVWSEIESLSKEMLEAPNVEPCKSCVALMFDYEAEWAWDIQPHGKGLSYFQLVFEYYVALRKLGLSIDIIRPDTIDLCQYRLIFVPGMMHMDDSIKSRLIECDATVVIGPRSGSRDKDFKIPEPRWQSWILSLKLWSPFALTIK